MKAALRSPLPAFHKELFDVADVFFPGLERLPEPDGGEDLLMDISQEELDRAKILAI